MSSLGNIYQNIRRRTGHYLHARRQTPKTQNIRIHADEECGFVFAATGPKYTILARRAARSLRLVMPDILIDLFTDQQINDPVFDNIHDLDHGFFRPKMEAIRRSRFDKTIILDADILVTADLSDIFVILDKYEMAGVQAIIRHKDMMKVRGQMPPRCFPVINTGVLAIRKSPRTSAFTQAWERSVRETGSPLDQPYFRKSLYESDLTFLNLPVEYNLIQLSALDSWGDSRGAPRVLHSRRLHAAPDPGDPMQPYTLAETLGSKRAEKFQSLIAQDWSVEQKTRAFWQGTR